MMALSDALGYPQPAAWITSRHCMYQATCTSHCLLARFGQWYRQHNYIVSQCAQCQAHYPSKTKEPMLACPFEELAAVFCHHAGQCYCVIVDCHTDWPNVVPMDKSAITTDLIKSCLHVQQSLTCFWSDGGPQFSSNQFQQFAKQWKIQHQMSSLYYR